MIIATSIFSKEKLEIQIQKADNRKIEILLIKDNEGNSEQIQVYQIQFGDTLSALALKLGNNIEELINLNNIKNRDLIIIDEKLKYLEKGEEE